MPSTEPTWEMPRSPTRTSDLACSWRGSHARSRRPTPPRTLYFLHLLLPHGPWRYLPSGREYGNSALSQVGGTRDGWNRWGDSPRWWSTGFDATCSRSATPTAWLGELMDRLHATGLYDPALIVVVADHGISFRPGGQRRLVSRENVADIAAVPLLVKYPFQTRGRDRIAATRRRWTSFPRSRDVLGVRLSWPTRRPVTAGHPGAGACRQGRATRRRIVRRLTGAGCIGCAEHGATERRRLGGRRPAVPRRTGSIAPRREAHGDLSVATGSQDRVELEGESLLATVDMRSAFLPVHIVGRVAGTGMKQLAIAVNGRIEVVTQSFRLDGTQRFAVLVPETAFHDGRNDVDVYAVDDTAPLALTRLGGTADTAHYRLAGDGALAAALRRRSGRDPTGALEGKVDSWVRDGGTVRIGGWAANSAGAPSLTACSCSRGPARL